jgi:DNA-directed RNA polymerase subunit H (RpoH/RPB5)
MVNSKVKNSASHMMFGEHTVVPHINTMWNERKRDVFGTYNSTNQPIPMINIKVMLVKCYHKLAKCGMLPK